MPVNSLILMLLIGLLFGGISAVALRSRKEGFIVNIALGVLGAALGAFMPVLMGLTTRVDVSTLDYLLRALLGAFLLVLVASLFRSAKPPGT